MRGHWKKIFARITIALFFSLFVLPLAVFSFGGQALYHRVFEAYMARDTVRLGMALRGTLSQWLLAWGGPFVFVGLLVFGIPITLVIFYFTKKASPYLKDTWWLVPVAAFLGCSHAFWVDFVESRSLQAAPPDTCFIHGVMHALHDGVTGKGWCAAEFRCARRRRCRPFRSQRIARRAFDFDRERARGRDVLGSAAEMHEPIFGSGGERSHSAGRHDDANAGDVRRVHAALDGNAAERGFQTAHSAPIIWEVAKAEGYRTAYITSQNLRYDDFGAFVRRASIDVKVSAMELGHTGDPMIGAPDELATPQMLDFIEKIRRVFRISACFIFRTRMRRIALRLIYSQNAPHSDNPTGDINAFHNQYLNSVLMQERTLAAFLKELRALPSFADTVVISFRITASNSRSTEVAITIIRCSSRSSGFRVGSSQVPTRFRKIS